MQEAQANSIKLHLAAKGKGDADSDKVQAPTVPTQGVIDVMQPIADKLNTLGVYNDETARLWNTVVGALRSLEQVCEGHQVDSGVWCADAAASAESLARSSAEQAEARGEAELETWANTFEQIMVVDGPLLADGVPGEEGALDPSLLQRWQSGKATKSDAKTLARNVLGKRAIKKLHGTKRDATGNV